MRRRGFVDREAFLEWIDDQKIDPETYRSLASTTYTTLGSDGQAVVVFTRSFSKKPGVNLTETDASGGSEPLFLRVLSWTRSGSLYTGCTIQGMRARELPELSPVSGILTEVVTGINTALAALSGFSARSATEASGATVSVHAHERSD